MYGYKKKCVNYNLVPVILLVSRLKIRVFL